MTPILKKLLLSLALFVLLWAALPLGICLANTYQITDQELTQLEMTLTKQEAALQKALTLLNGQERELTALKAQLQAALNELVKSKEEIQALKTSLNTALNSIGKANQSLKEYEKTMKNKLRAAKNQKNFWVVLASGLAYAAIKN